MRNLRSVEVHGMSVAEALEEFNGLKEKLGIVSEADVVSVVVMPPDPRAKLSAMAAGTASPKMLVVVAYWATEL